MIFCLDKADGQILWKSLRDLDYIYELAVSNEKIFVFAGKQQGVLAMDSRTGDVLWQRERIWRVITHFRDVSLIHDGVVFVRNDPNEHYLTAISEANGNVLWQKKLSSSPRGSTKPASRYIYQKDYYDNHYFLDAKTGADEMHRVNFKTIGIGIHLGSGP